MSTNIRNIFGTVVHDVPEGSSPVELRQFFGTVVHDGDPPFLVPDVTGTVNTAVTWDASSQSLDPQTTSFRWSWTSIPAGAKPQLLNASIPLQDNGGTAYFDMTDNVGLWHLDFPSAGDDSPEGNGGSIPAGASPAAGKIYSGTAFSFDGSQYVEVANDASLNSNTGTISIWIKFTASGSNMSIIGKHGSSSSINGWHLYIEGASNELRAQFKSTFATTTMSPATGALNDGEWHHIILVFEALGESKLYLDGALVATESSTLGFSVSSDPLRIAKSVDSFWDGFDGVIDEACLWSRKLSVKEVSDLFFLQSGSCATDFEPDPPSVGLVEAWSFTPDVVDNYEINLEMIDQIDDELSGVSLSGSVFAYVSAAPLCIQRSEVESNNFFGSGFVINTYNNLSKGRDRRVDQVPFKLGSKDRLGLRLDNTIATPSGSTPTYCDE